MYPMLFVYYALPDLSDLTHYLCLGTDPDSKDDALVEAPVTGDYGWGPTNQGVELKDGVLAQEV